MVNQDKGQNAGPEGDAARKPREPEQYPPVRQDDAVEASPPPRERRSFDPVHDAPVSTNEGRLGPGGDPAEGKP
ncbi:MAG: hypothetical protein JWQ29_1106 [Phenylobacterium sp.]|jgi:hypothetical protein|nr:hypothetical protein [Phenylobacterium sp.]